MWFNHWLEPRPPLRCRYWTIWLITRSTADWTETKDNNDIICCACSIFKIKLKLAHSNQFGVTPDFWTRAIIITPIQSEYLPFLNQSTINIQSSLINQWTAFHDGKVRFRLEPLLIDSGWVTVLAQIDNQRMNWSFSALSNVLTCYIQILFITHSFQLFHLDAESTSKYLFDSQ